LTVPNTLDIVARGRSRLSTAMSPSTPATEASMESLMVYSCGHTFAKAELFKETLPKFRALVDGFPTPLRLTTSLLVQEYNLATANVACPVCVYKLLREEQMRSGGSLPDWKF